MSMAANFKPKLLIGNYDSLDKFYKKVVYNNYLCIDQVVPMLRLRGTIVDATGSQEGKIKIIGWQRDVTRMRKMEVSLPFIVYITLDKDDVIESISLDETFNGGKGLLCSRNYLEKNVKAKLTGLTLDKTFSQKIKLDNIHCFHVYEVLNSIFSYYHALKATSREDGVVKGFFHEEEVVDCYAKNGNMYLAGLHEFKGIEPIEYRMEFYDIFNRVAFNNEGYMRIIEPVKADFYLNDQLLVSEILTQSENDYLFIKVQKFVLKCIGHLKELACPESKVRMVNTNLAPGALVGIMIQGITMRAFKDNYNYIQHVFTALQRPGRVPGCIGSILNDDEANQYFPGFDMDNLI